MTRHLKIVGWLYALLCGACLAVSLCVCVLFWPRPGAPGGGLGPFLGPVFLLATFTLPGLAAGVGLLRGRPWARLVITVLSLLLLPAIPVGTVFGAYALWAVLGTKSQRDRASRTTTRLLRGKGALLLVMAGVAALFAVALKWALMWHETRTPAAASPGTSPVLAVALGPLLLIAVAVVASGGWRRMVDASAPFAKGRPGVFSGWFGRRPWRDFDTLQRERVARLAADPARRKYAGLIRQGQAWSDAQIAYAEEPARLATCAHLQPVERAMRSAGIFMRLVHGPVVQSDCRIHESLLRLELGPEIAALYVERHDIDRSFHDPKTAMFQCPACQSSLIVIHPEEAAPATPWFPPVGAALADR